MPRQITVASQLYAVGTYGPYTTNGWNQNNTSQVSIQMTVESWPVQAAPLGLITITLQDGTVMEINIPSQPIDRATGLPATVFRCVLGIPEDQNGKRANSRATATLRVDTPFQTAITVTAE